MALNTILIIMVGLAALGGLFAILFFFWRTREDSARQFQEMARQIIDAQKQDQSLQLLQRELGSVREQLSKSMADSAKIMSDSQKTVGERLDRAAEVVGQVQKSLGAIGETTKQVFMVGKDIAQLQEILRAPKLRGSFGELFLGDLLAQILPPKSFTLQYPFKSGDIVDAVVKLGRLVPVDAKFPLENFKRLVEQQDPAEKTNARRKFVTDVKRHIDAIAEKYLRPDEGTYDFALMYIPAENVYYETIIKDDNVAVEDESLMAYAFKRRVVPVSPNSFYAYLHTIALGLRGLEVEKNARLILDQLARLRGDFHRFKEDFTLVGKHLNNTRQKYEDADRRLNRFEDKLLTTGGSEAATPTPIEETSPLEVLPFDKP